MKDNPWRLTSVSARLTDLGETGLAGQGAEIEEALAPPSSWTASWVVSEWALVGSIATALFFSHLLSSGRYGYFRDELYYAICGQHLSWGYVDHAPLIALLTRFTRGLFGDSLYSLRFLPALSAAAKILLTAWMVRELGGKRFAQVLAATVMFFCPVYLTMDSFLSMNSFEPLFWMGTAAIAMRIAAGGSPRLWLFLGAIAGVGILNKHSMLLFGLALLLGLLVSSGLRYFRSPWIWLGGLIAFAVFLPNLLWEIQNHYPTIEFLRNASYTKNAYVPWYNFIGQQALLVLPLSFPVCLAGLWFFFAAERGRPFRFLGWTYVLLLLLMIILRGRIYYLAPVYPMLFAAGAVWLEWKIAERNWDWAKQAILVPLAVGGIVAAPLAMPLLPVNAAADYASFWNVSKVHVETTQAGRLPQFFSDMIGWPEQAAVVASVYRKLSPEDQARCIILAGNYGEASAINYFGATYGLPRAISPHNSYYLWGPRENSGDVVITLGIDEEVLHSLFGEVQQVAAINTVHAMPAETNLPVYVCRKPRQPLSQAWPRLKSYR